MNYTASHVLTCTGAPTQFLRELHEANLTLKMKAEGMPHTIHYDVVTL